MNANLASAASPAPALLVPPRSAASGSGSVRTLDSLNAYQVSLDACRRAALIADSLNANLRDQLLRASSSVALNIAEGFGSTSRGIKRRHYAISRGSAIECLAILDLASVIGIGDGVGDGVGNRETARALFTRVAMMTAKLVARFR